MVSGQISDILIAKGDSFFNIEPSNLLSEDCKEAYINELQNFTA